MTEGAVDGRRKKVYNSKKVSIDMLLVGPGDGIFTHNIKIDKQ